MAWQSIRQGNSNPTADKPLDGSQGLPEVACGVAQSCRIPKALSMDPSPISKLVFTALFVSRGNRRAGGKDSSMRRSVMPG
jgi:hypothetical protein